MVIGDSGISRILEVKYSWYVSIFVLKITWWTMGEAWIFQFEECSTGNAVHENVKNWNILKFILNNFAVMVTFPF